MIKNINKTSFNDTPINYAGIAQATGLPTTRFFVIRNSPDNPRSFVLPIYGNNSFQNIIRSGRSLVAINTVTKSAYMMSPEELMMLIGQKKVRRIFKQKEVKDDKGNVVEVKNIVLDRVWFNNITEYCSPEITRVI